jgi:glycosyltransferase involved in cell wall biosynthesis
MLFPYFAISFIEYNTEEGAIYMKILQGPTEIAGQIGTLSRHLHDNGYQVGGYNWFHSYLNYKSNIINTDLYEITKEILTYIDHFDIFHFHNGETFLPNFADLPLIKDAGKKMVMHHWGNDVRNTKLTKELNPYPLPPGYFSDEDMHKRLLILSKYIDTAIVQDYEVLPYVKDYYKHVHVMPLAFDIHKFQASYPRINNPKPLLIHAPTNREFKGSEYVENAIKKLKKETFTYKIIEKTSYQEALKTYMESDIIIDQLLCGTYGMLAVEAMAMGKVVVGFIRDDVRNQLPFELPIVTATPDNLRGVLKDLIRDPKNRNEIGQKGRNYVEEYHAAEKVVKQLIAIYNQL